MVVVLHLVQAKTPLTTVFSLRRIGETEISTLSFTVLPLPETIPADLTVIPDLLPTKDIPRSGSGLREPLNPGLVKRPRSFVETSDVPQATR